MNYFQKIPVFNFMTPVRLDFLRIVMMFLIMLTVLTMVTMTMILL
jgi:hypothetical protein